MRFFQNTPMAIATVDKTGGIARSNARFASAFESLLKGESARSSSAVTERDRPGAGSRHCKSGGKGRVTSRRSRPRSPVRSERWANFFVSAVDEDDRDGEAAIVYALETTAQRTLENRIYQQQKMESVGQLAGGIAHDFNNVLSAIMMATDFLLNAHKPTDPSFQDIIQIKQNANRAAALVRQLLAFSRKQTLRPQVLDLGETLIDLGMLLKRLIGEKVTFPGVVIGRDLWPVKVDISQFEQVIVNLAVNARDAMPDGGTADHPHRQCAGRRDGEVRLQGNAERPTTCWWRSATPAPASRRDIMDKIFDPFFTTKEVGKGTGLGLSTVYGIVKQTGGFVYADSKPGRPHSAFSCRAMCPAPTRRSRRFPAPRRRRSPARMTAAENMARAAADLTGHGTILLVEDEEGLRALNARGPDLAWLYRPRGGQWRRGDRSAGERASIDLVVSDVVMPEMDGPTLLKELRRRNPERESDFRLRLCRGSVQQKPARARNNMSSWQSRLRSSNWSPR